MDLRSLRALGYLVVLLVLPLRSFAAPLVLQSQADPKSRWYGFAEVSSLAGFESSGGNCFTWQASWRPTWELSPEWALRGNLGLTVFKALDGKFLATEYQVIASASHFAPYLVELGAGVQTWFGHGGTHPLLGLSVARKLGKPFASVIDRVIAGYSAYFYPGDYVHQLKLGIGIAL